MSRKNRQKKRLAERKAQRKEATKVHLEQAPPPYRGHVPLEKVDEVRFRVPQRGLMRTHGMVYSDEALLPDLQSDRCLEQVANVATLPGIVGASMAMPDIHMGYGFPIGGVAAFDMQEGIVSPGGVGYDINCGVRLLSCDADVGALAASKKGKFRQGEPSAKLSKLTEALFEAIPAGMGRRRKEVGISSDDLDEVLEKGLGWAFRKGYATRDDLLRVEEGGCLEGAQSDAVSQRARQRGKGQLGTLGSGNHFAEVGYVDTIYDAEAAEAYGLREGGLTLMIHSGSRGLGHQVCTDHIQTMLQASANYGIKLVDRQLCCAPIPSPEAQAYLAAMNGAANFAFVNRQLMTHFARQVFGDVLGAELKTVYDVCHNIAKAETHAFEGVQKEVMVHRKGATRALPAGHSLVPKAYRNVGQPVVIPGDMGRYSFVLRGAATSAETFGSACHGAGRVLSRSAAKRLSTTGKVQQALRAKGVVVKGASKATIVEEMPEAYKDVAEVVSVVHTGGIAERVARIRPLGCVKG